MKIKELKAISSYFLSTLPKCILIAQNFATSRVKKVLPFSKKVLDNFNKVLTFFLLV